MMSSISHLSRLRRLHHWLTLEGWAGVVGLAGFWLPVGLVARLLTVAAVVFTPVLVASLWRLDRRGWLVGFGVWVGGAALAGSLLAGPWVGLRAIPALFAFYTYTWALKLAVAEWVREAEERAEWTRTKAHWDAESEAERMSRA